MRLFLSIILSVVVLTGCETTKQVGRAGGEVAGEGTNILGSVTEGGAGAVQGKTTKEENPFNR